MTTAEILEKAAALIEPAGAWTQGEYAIDAAGRYVDFASTRACAWCATGAMLVASGSDDALSEESAYWDAKRVLSDAIGGAVTLWNDAPGRTQDEVVQALRDAAKAAPDA